MKAIGRALKRITQGLIPMKYSFNIVLSLAQNFPMRIQGSIVQAELKRGMKTRSSGPAAVQLRNGAEVAVWEETLSVTVTMFKDPKKASFTEKEAKLSINVIEGPTKTRCVGSIYLNLAEFVLAGTQEFREQLVLPLSNASSKRQRKYSRQLGAQQAPRDATFLTCTVQTWWLQDYKRREDASSHLSDRTGVTATTAGALGDTDWDDSDEEASPEPHQHRHPGPGPAPPAPQPAWQSTQPPPLAQPAASSSRPSVEAPQRRNLFGVDPGPAAAPPYRPPPPPGPPPPAPQFQQQPPAPQFQPAPPAPQFQPAPPAPQFQQAPQHVPAPYRPPPPAGPPPQHMPPMPQPAPPLQQSIPQPYRPPPQPGIPVPYHPPPQHAPPHPGPPPPPAPNYMPEPAPLSNSFRGRDPAPVFRPIGAAAPGPQPEPPRVPVARSRSADPAAAGSLAERHGAPLGMGPGAAFLGAGPPINPAGGPDPGRGPPLVRSAYSGGGPGASRGPMRPEQESTLLQQPARPPSFDRSASGGQPPVERSGSGGAGPGQPLGSGIYPSSSARSLLHTLGASPEAPRGAGAPLGPPSLAPAFSHAQGQIAGRAQPLQAPAAGRSSGPAPPLRRDASEGSDGPTPAETPRSVAAYGPGPGVSAAALTRALNAAQQAEAGQREAELRRLHDLEGRVKTLYLANVELQRERQQLQDEKAALAAQLKAAEERAAWLHGDRERLNEQLNRGAAKDQHLRAAEDAVARVERERDRIAGELRVAREAAARQRAGLDAELREAVERAWADSAEQHRASAARLADENTALRRRVDELAVLAAAPRSPSKAAPPAPGPNAAAAAAAAAGRVEFVCAQCKIDPLRRGTYKLADGRSVDEVEDLIGAKLALAEAHSDLHELRNAMAKMKRRSNALEDEIRKAKLILETHVPGYKSDSGVLDDIASCLPVLSQPPADFLKG